MVRRKSVGMLEELDGRSASASERIVSTWMWGCSANWFGCVWNPRITHRSLMVIDRTSLKWHQSQTEYLPVKTQINSAIVGWNILFHLIGCGVWGQLNTRGHFSNCYNLQEPRDNLQEQRTFCFQNIREVVQTKRAIIFDNREPNNKELHRKLVAILAMFYMVISKAMRTNCDGKGSFQNKYSVKVGNLAQGGGGVWPNPNFYK